MKPRFLLCIVLVQVGGWFAFIGIGQCDPVASIPFPRLALQSIHMQDRKDGWAQTTARVFTGNGCTFPVEHILRTTDGGRSWKSVLTAAAPGQCLSSCFYDSKTAWVGAYDEDATTNLTVFRTRNGGLTWEQSRLCQPKVVMDCSVSFPSVTNGWLMLMPDHGMNSEPGDLYETTDGGVSWRLVNSTQASTRDWIFEDAALPEFTNQYPYLICGGLVSFQSSATGWMVGSLASTTPAFLFMSRDNGRNWQVQSLPLLAEIKDGRMEPMDLPIFFPPDGKEGILPAQFVPTDNRATHFATVIYFTRDGGLRWQATAPVKFSGVWSFINAKNGYVWSSEPHNTDSTAPVKGTLYRTRDGGKSWKPVRAIKGLDEYLTHGQDIDPMDEIDEQGRDFQLNFVDGSCGWAIARDSHNFTQLLHTDDGGKTWNCLQTTIQP